MEPIEFRQLRSIQLAIKTKITRQPLPTLADVIDKQKESLGRALKLIIESGAHLTYKSVLKDLPEDYEFEDLAAATLCYHLEGIPEAARPKEPRFPDTGAAPGQVRFFLNMGQVQKVTQDDIIKKIAHEADLTPEAVAKVRVYDAFSFLEVPEAEAEKVYAVMNKNMWKGYRVRLEPARGRDGGNSKPRFSGPPPQRSSKPAHSGPRPSASGGTGGTGGAKKSQGGAPWKSRQKS